MVSIMEMKLQVLSSFFILNASLYLIVVTLNIIVTTPKSALNLIVVSPNLGSTPNTVPFSPPIIVQDTYISLLLRRSLNPIIFPTFIFEQPLRICHLTTDYFIVIMDVILEREFPSSSSVNDVSMHDITTNRVDKLVESILIRTRTCKVNTSAVKTAIA